MTTNGKPGPLTVDPAASLSGPGWVHHDGIAYLFPGEQTLHVRNDRKSAPWSAINQAGHTALSKTVSLKDTVAEGDVFCLWIDHGAPIYKPVTYSYVIAPDLAPADIPTFQQTAPRILANTADLQSVAADRTVQAVFWKPGTLAWPDGLSVTADQPCALQLKPAPDGAYAISAGNPEQRARTLEVRLQDRSGNVAASFVFPEGSEAGRSKTRVIAPQ